MPIRFFSQSLDFKIQNPLRVKRWLKNVFLKENILKKIDLNIIFCTDNELLEINKTYLNHDFYTDIITFVLEEDKIKLEAELYISIERVNENASKLDIPFKNELKRVIVHGALHLCNYNDQTQKEKSVIRDKESHYLSYY